MANETYIFNQLQKQIAKNYSRQQNLNQIADYLCKNYDVKVRICEIFGGRRWSFIAGVETTMAGGKQIKINDQLGLIVKNYDQLSSQEWQLVTEFIAELN